MDADAEFDRVYSRVPSRLSVASRPRARRRLPARARKRPSRTVAACGKEGEDGVADDIEHLAALLHYGAGRAIEIGVEQVEKGFDRELIGKARRVPEIAIPERGGKPFAIAALDRTGQDATADERPMKGIERALVI